MNVQRVCDFLAERRQAELQALTGETVVPPQGDLAEALTPEWLSENIQAIFDAVERSATVEGSVKQDEHIGNLEVNAFLACFQRACEAQQKTRLQRWAGAASFKKRLLYPNGALNKQMRNIGVKVDDEYKERVEE